MENSVDSILNALEKMSANREPIDAHTWLDGCSKLLALIGNEQNRLFEMENELAKVKLLAMENGETGMKAKVRVEATPLYLETKKLKAKIERCYEIIKVSKIQARMSIEDLRGQI